MQRLKESSQVKSVYSVLLALCVILGYASEVSSWDETRNLLCDKVWEDMAIYPQGGWGRRGGASFSPGLKVAWSLIKDISLSDSFVGSQALGLVHEWVLLVSDLAGSFLT